MVARKPMNIAAMMSGAGAGGAVGSDITKGPAIATDLQAEKLITKYMLQQNRPYSAIQVTDNLHKRIQKGGVERVLGKLVAASVLRQKDYGKASIFFPHQDKVAESLGGSVAPAVMADMKRQEAAATVECQEVADALAAAETEAAVLAAEPTDAHLDGELAELAAEVAARRARVAAAGGATVDPQARDKAVTAHNFFLKTWKTLKRKVTDFSGSVADSMGKKTKEVQELFGLELDEQEQALMPQAIPEPGKPGNRPYSR